MAKLPVDSTCLSDVDYDETTRALTLTFRKDGSVYTYDNVSAPEVDALVESGSVGRHFNYSVRCEYPYRRR
jgi:hypothetical protein